MFDEDQPTLLIVDGHALIYRAYHAFPPLTDDEGQIVGALYGFLRILLATLRSVEPAYCLVTFDDAAPTKRKLEYSFYKANRPAMPDDLRPQIPLIEEAVAKMGIPVFKVPGVEADDLIGTISRQETESGAAKVLILTGDKDSFQLVTDQIHVLVPQVGSRGADKKNRGATLEYNPAMVEQKMGVAPNKIADLKGLAGDSSDNISGVPGIGPKTAVDLIKKFNSVEGVYQAIDQENVSDLRAALVAKLVSNRETAAISKHLATIDQHVADLDFQLDKCRLSGYDKNEMAEFLTRFNFNSLLKYLPADDFDTGLQEALF